MTMTDPIADMLTRLRNANSAYHDTVTMPYSKIKSHIAEILKQEGYIAGWKVEDAEVGKSLRHFPQVRPEPGAVDCRPAPGVQARLAGLREVDQSAARSWRLGIAIISTSSGLLTDRQAAKKRVGGEVLAFVW